MAVVTTQLRTARRRSIKASGICQLTDSPPASHKRINHMARGIQKHVIRREAVLSQNPNWRSRRLPRIAIDARATDKLTARLLSLEFLDRHSIITPREADELESLQCWRSTLKS
jgi:hypothetical protein